MGKLCRNSICVERDCGASDTSICPKQRDKLNNIYSVLVATMKSVIYARAFPCQILLRRKKRREAGIGDGGGVNKAFAFFM